MTLLLCIGIANLGFAEVDIDPTNPDSLFNVVIDTQKTLKKAQTALLKNISQEDWESDKEFDVREAQLLLDGNDEIRTAQEGLRQVIDMITNTTWRVSDNKVSVTADNIHAAIKDKKFFVGTGTSLLACGRLGIIALPRLRENIAQITIKRELLLERILRYDPFKGDSHEANMYFLEHVFSLVQPRFFRGE